MKVKLVMFASDGRQKGIRMAGDDMIIGRGDDCDLRIPIPIVSRHHCELNVVGDELKLKDLGSANGTYVNGVRINESVIQPGDSLSIGPVNFVVQIDGVPEQVSAPETVANPAGASDEDEIVELKADALTPAAAEEELSFDFLNEDEKDQIDPISALEDLADKDEEKTKPDES